MYKLILFDFDGTVFDTGEGIMKSVQYAALAFGYDEPDYTALRCFVGPPLVESFMRRYGVDMEKARAMTAKYRERYSVQGLAECSVYPGVPELIAELLDRHGSEGAVMVGDRDNDVNGAKKCGIPCVGVAWGYAEPGELLAAGAVSLAQTVDELEDILTR